MSSCVGRINCPTMYLATSNASSKKVHITTQSAVDIPEACNRWVNDKKNNDNYLEYNPCPSQTDTCCKNDDDTYYPHANDGQCYETCNKWEMFNTTPQSWGHNLSSQSESESCPDIGYTKKENRSDYEYDGTVAGTSSRCQSDEVPYFMSNNVIVCSSASSCRRTDFDKVVCATPIIYGKAYTVNPDTCSNDSSGQPTLADCLDIDDDTTILLSPSVRSNAVTNLISLTSNLEMNNLKVVIGTVKPIPLSRDETQFDVDVGSYLLEDIQPELANLSEKKDATSELDKYFEATLIPRTPPTGSTGSTESVEVNKLFDIWNLKRISADNYAAETDYKILSGDLQLCDSFYDSEGKITSLDNPGINDISEENEYSVVQFSNISLSSRVYRTCPMDPYFSNINDKNVSCVNENEPYTGDSSIVYCCINDYSNNCLETQPDESSSGYILPKILTPTCSTLSPSANQITRDGVNLYCGPPPTVFHDNILNDEDSTNPIHMYPGYDHEYINYKKITHDYYNGNHSSNG